MTLIDADRNSQSTVESLGEEEEKVRVEGEGMREEERGGRGNGTLR